jgi:hypothetical protein
MIPRHWFPFHDSSNWFTKELCLGSCAGVILNKCFHGGSQMRPNSCISAQLTPNLWSASIVKNAVVWRDSHTQGDCLTLKWSLIDRCSHGLVCLIWIQLTFSMHDMHVDSHKIGLTYDMFIDVYWSGTFFYWSVMIYIHVYVLFNVTDALRCPWAQLGWLRFTPWSFVAPFWKSLKIIVRKGPKVEFSMHVQIGVMGQELMAASMGFHGLRQWGVINYRSGPLFSPSGVKMT